MDRKRCRDEERNRLKRDGMKGRRIGESKTYLESGDEAEMIEQSPLEVGFILPVFSPK